MHLHIRLDHLCLTLMCLLYKPVSHRIEHLDFERKEEFPLGTITHEGAMMDKKRDECNKKEWQRRGPRSTKKEDQGRISFNKTVCMIITLHIHIILRWNTRLMIMYHINPGVAA